MMFSHVGSYDLLVGEHTLRICSLAQSNFHQASPFKVCLMKTHAGIKSPVWTQAFEPPLAGSKFQDARGRVSTGSPRARTSSGNLPVYVEPTQKGEKFTRIRRRRARRARGLFGLGDPTAEPGQIEDLCAKDCDFF